MDSLTHALAISVIFALIGRPDLIPFAALGAVIPDIDVIFQRFSDSDPGLYIFTHGGITHSLAGGAVTAAAFSIAGFGVAAMAIPGAAAGGPLTAIGAGLLGLLSHLLLDYLAYPGIPLLYPLSDRKYTLGIMAGPSLYLTFASVAYLALLAAGQASIAQPWLYVGFFTVVITLSAVLKVYVRSMAGDVAIPGFNQLHWLIVKETPEAYKVSKFSLTGRTSGEAVYEKISGPVQAGRSGDFRVPELRRMRYHSYIVTEEHGEDYIRYVDPLREHGYLWYPPYFKSVTIPVKKISGR